MEKNAGADAKAQVNGKGKAPAAGAAGGGTGAAPSVPGFAPGEGVRDSAPSCDAVPLEGWHGLLGSALLCGLVPGARSLLGARSSTLKRG